jgi:hypothetical protein
MEAGRLLRILSRQAATASMDTGSDVETDTGSANAIPGAKRALTDSHGHHVRMERLLRGAGLADDETWAPEDLPIWMPRVRVRGGRLGGELL